MSQNQILKPVITEKSFFLAQNGQFTFLVTRSSTKHSIKKAVEDLFKVDVIKVRILKNASKTRQSGKKRLKFKTSPKTKAIVTLKEGQSIEYFQLPDQKQDAKTKTTKKQAPKSKPTQKTEKPKKGRGLFGLGRRKQPTTKDK